MTRRLGLLAALAVAALSLPSVAQADSTWYVGSAADGCPNAQFSDLTSAVTFAQPHDTIRICPGTYTVGPAAGTTPTAVGLQGLVIDKPLTIIGAGASKVTIEPATNLVSGTSSSDNLRDSSGNVITVTNTTPGDTSDWDVNPTISGVTISNGGFLVDAGIAFNNETGAIIDSRIEPFAFSGAPPATNGPSYGWGVVASNNYAVTPQGAFERDVTVSADLIADYGGGGVLIDGSESSKPIYFRSGIATTGSITNNVITGSSDPTLVQQYGVQVNAGARAAITGNVITGNLGATPGTATNPGTGVGVLLTDADVSSTVPGSPTSFYTTVTGNDLTGNGYGIFNGTADFQAAPSTDPNQSNPIDVNGTGTTPSNLPASLTNVTQSTATAPVTVDYQVPGVVLQASSRPNYFGPDKGVPGGPSTATDDGISESTLPGTDSVKFGSPPATPYATPSAPGAVTDSPPTAAWGTPDGVVQTTLQAGQADELLVAASDDFGVASVDINANGTDLGTLTLPPYEATWTPPRSLIGDTVPLVATVTDSSGQTTTATITVKIIANTPPGGGGGSGGGGGGGGGGPHDVATTATTPAVTSPSPAPSSVVAPKAKIKPKALRVTARIRHGRLKITGKLVLPGSVKAEDAYAGKVEISWLRHHLTVRLSREGRLEVAEKAVAKGTKLTVRFAGNLVLDAVARVVRVG